MKKERTSMNANSNLSPETKVAIFKGKEIRKTIHNNEWWFSVADVIGVLTDSTDVRQYVKKMRQRDPQLDSYWGTICTPLELLAQDGKKRETNCSNTVRS
jgi:DNA-damage-inducible protein D